MSNEDMNRKTIDKAVWLYDALQNYLNEHKHLPGLRDLLPIVDMKSISTVEYYLIILRDWGWIDWRKGKARTIRLTRTTERIIERKAKATKQHVA